MKILIIDDEPGWRDLLSLELSSAGYETVTASNASEAAALLQQQAFPLIVSDAQMPGEQDGIDFIRICRQKNPEQKAILITGYAVEERIKRILEKDRVICVRKPFENEELVNAIQSLFPPSGKKAG